jgi:hypothetical protein
MAAGTSLYNDLYNAQDALTIAAGSTCGGRGLKDGVNGVINTTVTQLTLSPAVHANKTLVVDSAAPIAITLPAATGTGDVYTIFIDTAATATASTILAAGSDKMYGVCLAATTASNAVKGYLITTGATTISLNGTTTGGVKGDVIYLTDCKASVWSVEMTTAPTGTTATPFS